MSWSDWAPKYLRNRKVDILDMIENNMHIPLIVKPYKQRMYNVDDKWDKTIANKSYITIWLRLAWMLYKETLTLYDGIKNNMGGVYNEF